ADQPLVAVVQRLLQKDPLRRYGDAMAVIRDLSAAMGRPLPVETAATRESFLQAARFVGREAEAARLRAALDEGMAGRGSAWLVSGESGVGKSRLIDELRIRALVSGALVLRGQSVSEASAPYQVWREPVRRLALALDLSPADAAALRPAAPDIAALLGRPLPDAGEADPEQARRRLQATLMSLFHRYTGPLALILEDLHWADSASLDALRELSESAARLPLLVVASYRDDETPDLPVRLPAMQTLPLRRLEPGAIAALSESMLGEGGRAPDVLGLLQRETEGNVFFLIEVVRALAEEAGQLDRIGTMTLPAHVFTGGVRRIVARRLGKLSPGDRPVLQLAAVYGRELDLPILRAAASISEADLQAWLARAADAAVLDVQDQRWRFAHDKLREGALEAIPAGARPALHAHVARAIEHVAPNRVAALAYHWGMAGDRKRETHYSALAGEEADRVSAFPEAIRYFERALELTGDGDRAGRAALDVRLGRVLVRLNRHEEAIARLEEALVTARAPGVNAPRAAAAALVYLGHAFRARGLPDEARAHYENGLLAGQDAGDRRLASEASRGLAHLAAGQGEYDAAIARLTDSLTLCREIADQWGIANALSDLARVLTIRGAHEDAAARLEEALGIFRGLGDRRGMASALLNLGTVALYQGNPAGAVHHFEESLAISRQIGDRWNVAATLNNLGYVALSNGDFAKASASLAESLALFREIGDRAAVAQTLINLGHVATQLDQDGDAAAHYREALAMAVEMDAAPLSLEILAGMGRLRARAGQYEAAAELAGLALGHPAVNPDVRAIAEPLVAELRAKLPPDAVEAALARGKSRKVDEVSREVMGE
ncbi:MAG: tetratricopeptide repeat protein, partial [Anaerolineae bacterium]|nr:tetratricopeptide repeat protein [Anaerolineae bacterium]